MTEKEYPCGTVGFHFGAHPQGIIALSGSTKIVVCQKGTPWLGYTDTAKRLFGAALWSPTWCLVEPEEWL